MPTVLHEGIEVLHCQKCIIISVRINDSATILLIIYCLTWYILWCRTESERRIGIDVIRLLQVKHVVERDDICMFRKTQEYLT
jgi:hypothetical protein